MLKLPIVAVAIFTIACAASIEEPAAGTHVAVTRLRGEPYSFAYYSGVTQPERLVIRDEAAWQAAWATIWPAFAPIPAAPGVDFSKEMIVLVALGGRSTGGYSILVDSAMTTSTGLTVWIGTSSPGATCITTQAFTQPIDIARIQRIDAPVHFVDVPSVTHC